MIFTLLMIALGCFSYKRLLHYLQYLQQEEYQPRRFLHWLKDKRACDTRGTIVCLASLIAFAIPEYGVGFLVLIAALAFFGLAFIEEDPRKVGKISLKMTPRAKRIFLVSFVMSCLYLTTYYVASFYSPPLLCVWSTAVLFIHLQPIFLVLAVIILQPDEGRRQQKFLNEAKKNLARVKPYVIAITGSYGKTSTKAILGKLLEFSLGPTFWPPKSINTPMGITRELRENLKLGHKYAVVEMGAYQQGSISKLCELTPPSAGIVTAVGLMHLERFGSPENVYKAKSELPVRIPACGILVCNGDNPGSRRMAGEYKKAQTFLYGLESDGGHLDCFVDNVAISPGGTTFHIHWKGMTYPCQTRLHGKPALSNILAAFTMAVALGAEPANLVAAISALEPFDNRLEVIQGPNGIQVNDAYNSNPDGFLAALEVLRDLPGKRRILMTPGMVELGELQRQENARIAEAAARICDIVIIVGPINREAITDGLNRGGLAPQQQFYRETRDLAFKTLAEIRQEGDIVLLENDLPDLYEGKIAF